MSYSSVVQLWISTAKRLTGIDRAIAFTAMARAVQMLGSVGTVLLIAHVLSPVEQGYYYTLLSLVALQVIFEMGFTLVLLQVTAHESAHLTFYGDGRIEGSRSSRARLASILQTSMRWYLFAGILMCVFLLTVGMHFFQRHSSNGVEVHWRGPWAATVLLSVVTFLSSPVFSFLEGCGEVLAVARVRLWQSLAGITLAWAAMLFHHGLFSPAMVLTGSAMVSVVFFAKRRRLVWPLLRYSVGEFAIDWRNEVWPFQWRIAISWIATYFSAQVLIPILFACRGAVEAGRMGMSMSVAGYLGALVLSWMHTKASPFGRLVAQKQFVALDHLFFLTLKQSSAILISGSALSLVALVVLQRVLPHLASRMVPLPTFALLLVTGVGTYIVQCEAIYLRAHKFEPFMIQSMMVATLTVIGAALLTGPLGVRGVVLAYFSSSGVAGLAIATTIFQRRRLQRGAGTLDFPNTPNRSAVPPLDSRNEQAATPVAAAQ